MRESREVNDPRYWTFERRSGLPAWAFDTTPRWMRRARPLALALLVLALVLAYLTGGSLPNL